MDDHKKLIAQLREDFTKGSLSETDVHKDPSVQFDLWLKQAVDSNVPEAHAVHLATVSEQGKPSGRIVYLREYEDHHFWFYTNYSSKKAKELIAKPFASLTFFWPELERQIRIEGPVEKASDTYSDNYFNARPYLSKIGAWASHQSHKLNTREELQIRVEELKKELSPETIQRPQFWGGYYLKATYYEFWQGRKSRLHDRICYELKNNAWETFRIAP
jgi:pyridoxamine 5'-phosphate oxidase